MKRQRFLSLFVVLAVGLLVGPVLAGTFKKTKEMDVYYAFGTSDWGDFDYYESNGWIPYAEVTLFNDGTLFAFDTGSGQSGGGTYNKQGRYLDLDVGPIYSGERVSRGPAVYEGEIIYNGQVSGLWRGYVR